MSNIYLQNVCSDAKKAICDWFLWHLYFYSSKVFHCFLHPCKCVLCFIFKPTHATLTMDLQILVPVSGVHLDPPPFKSPLSVCQVSHTQLLCPFEWGSSLAMNAANRTNTALFTLCGKSAAVCSHWLFLVFPLVATKQYVYEMWHILTQTRYHLYFHLYSLVFLEPC